MLQVRYRDEMKWLDMKGWKSQSKKGLGPVKEIIKWKVSKAGYKESRIKKERDGRYSLDSNSAYFCFCKLSVFLIEESLTAIFKSLFQDPSYRKFRLFYFLV